MYPKEAATSKNYLIKCLQGSRWRPLQEPLERPLAASLGSIGLNAFIDEFSHIISSLENNKNHLILAGDFNINLLKLNENVLYSNFFDTLISHSLYPLIILPTRFTRITGILIDNFLQTQ